MPQFILNEAASNSVGCRIAVTQPRRIAAISVANRVAAERGWKTGEIVGYQVGRGGRYFFSCNCSNYFQQVQ